MPTVKFKALPMPEMSYERYRLYRCKKCKQEILYSQIKEHVKKHNATTVEIDFT